MANGGQQEGGGPSKKTSGQGSETRRTTEVAEITNLAMKLHSEMQLHYPHLAEDVAHLKKLSEDLSGLQQGETAAALPNQMIQIGTDLDWLALSTCILKGRPFWSVNWLSTSKWNIDPAKEEINLEVRDNVTVDRLAQRVPRDHPRYHLFLFPHKHQGEKFKSIVFIYSIAGSECPIKERMLYSSCKLPLVDTIETQVGVPITKKVEIDDPSELNEAFLIDQLHPKQNICKQKFAKPKGPANRGARRLIRTTDPEN
ncbi:twinfilin-like [Dermacentor silvarum]|uniref:twinfilin-like n=1 Tax=Dermacentor silvarum TaxID=543639 RepID=UPI0021010838|nr:twinfilin-like [Dermacentor silvarum]